MQGRQDWVPGFADSLLELDGLCKGAGPQEGASPDVISMILLSGSTSWPHYVARPVLANSSMEMSEQLDLRPDRDVAGSATPGHGLGALAVEVVRKLGCEHTVDVGRYDQ
jgi:hypothetical protein